MNVESFRLKDPLEWTPSEVSDFLASILPGHVCLDYFRHTSGYVLCSLEKEDLRKQTKNDEATNVIWMELGSRKKGASPVRGVGTKALVQRGGLDPRSTLTLYVKAPRQGAALELEMAPMDTIAFLKAQVEVHEGTPPESQRLVFRGATMQDDRSLTSYGLQHGDSVLLIPTLRDQVPQSRAVFAPRGLLSLPGSKAWSPSSRSAFLPVLFSDVSRNFPISMEFSEVADCEAFAEAARYAPPWLEILPGGPGRPPADVKCRLDPDHGAVCLEATTGRGGFLPNSTYQAVAHFGGRGGQVQVCLVTGSAVSAC